MKSENPMLSHGNCALCPQMLETSYYLLSLLLTFCFPVVFISLFISLVVSPFIFFLEIDEGVQNIS
jgi:hypothetical protein